MKPRTASFGTPRIEIDCCLPRPFNFFNMPFITGEAMPCHHDYYIYFIFLLVNHIYFIILRFTELLWERYKIATHASYLYGERYKTVTHASHITCLDS